MSGSSRQTTLFKLLYVWATNWCFVCRIRISFDSYKNGDLLYADKIYNTSRKFDFYMVCALIWCLSRLSRWPGYWVMLKTCALFISQGAMSGSAHQGKPRYVLSILYVWATNWCFVCRIRISCSILIKTVSLEKCFILLFCCMPIKSIYIPKIWFL